MRKSQNFGLVLTDIIYKATNQMLAADTMIRPLRVESITFPIFLINIPNILHEVEKKNHQINR